MATESVITAARIDRQFTDSRGQLTQNGYAILAGLLRRTGGPVGLVIDVPEIYSLINTAQVTANAAAAAVAALSVTVTALQATVAALSDALEAQRAQLGDLRIPDYRARIETIEGRLQ